VQKSLPHQIENTADSDLVFVEMFKADCFQDFSFSSGWLTPRRDCYGAFVYRQSDPRCDSKRATVDNSDMINLCARIIVG